MASNEILPFAGNDTGTNLLTQAEYIDDTQRANGNQPGGARSKLVNKVLRQTSLISAAIAQYFANRQSSDITDSLAPATIAGYMLNAIGGDTQKCSFNSAVAGGTADALTGAFTPAISSLPVAPGTLSVMVRAASSNTITTPTFKADGTAAKVIVKGSNQALAQNDIAGAGHWLHLDYDPTLDKYVLQNPATGVTQPTNTAPVVGIVRNGKMSVTAASASGAFTADEIIAETALGGTAYKLSNYSQTINLATTGAGGMDTGAAPTSGYVSLYAIVKADGTKNILACNVTTSSSSTYGGSNMPSGYVASALIGIWPTNGSGQLVAGLIMDPFVRTFQYASYPSIFTAHAPITTLTSQSISAGVPAAARTVDMVLGTTYIGGQAQNPAGVSPDAAGTGAVLFDFINGTNTNATAGGMANMSGFAHFKNVPLLTAQTVYLFISCTNNSAYAYVSGYSW